MNMQKEEKTNVMRLLDAKKIAHESYFFDCSSAPTGEEVAAILNKDARQVFKTLVTAGKSGAHYVTKILFETILFGVCLFGFTQFEKMAANPHIWKEPRQIWEKTCEQSMCIMQTTERTVQVCLLYIGLCR